MKKVDIELKQKYHPGRGNVKFGPKVQEEILRGVAAQIERR
jgi:hypothetical protein